MITGKKIVITGGTSGIGRAIVDMLAAESSNTVIVAARSAAELTDYGKNVIPFPCDISTREGVDSLFEKIEEIYDKADIFIANAGAAYYEKFDYEDWDRVQAIFNLNAVSPMYTYTKYIHHLDGRQGHLAYTVSAIGEMALPGFSLYAASKFAMKGFQQGIRLEAPDNLKLTCIYPVSTDTNFFKVAADGIDMEKPFPVQTAKTVAKTAIKAIEKGKKNGYPCLIWPPAKALMSVLPIVRNIYWKIEKVKFARFLDRKEKAESDK